MKQTQTIKDIQDFFICRDEKVFVYNDRIEIGDKVFFKTSLFSPSYPFMPDKVICENDVLMVEGFEPLLMPDFEVWKGNGKCPNFGLYIYNGKQFKKLELGCDPRLFHFRHFYAPDVYCLAQYTEEALIRVNFYQNGDKYSFKTQYSSGLHDFYFNTKNQVLIFIYPDKYFFYTKLGKVLWVLDGSHYSEMEFDPNCFDADSDRFYVKTVQNGQQIYQCFNVVTGEKLWERKDKHRMAYLSVNCDDGMQRALLPHNDNIILIESNSSNGKSDLFLLEEGAEAVDFMGSDNNDKGEYFYFVQHGDKMFFIKNYKYVQSNDNRPRTVGCIDVKTKKISECVFWAGVCYVDDPIVDDGNLYLVLKGVNGGNTLLRFELTPEEICSLPKKKRVFPDSSEITDTVSDAIDNTPSVEKEKRSMTLLVLAAECEDFVWNLISDTENIIMDYSILYALECGYNKVVITVSKSQQKSVSAFVDRKKAKYAIDIDVVTVDASNHSHASQLFEALKVIQSNDLIVVSADCFYDKEMFKTVARRLRVNNRSCMVGYLPVEKFDFKYRKDWEDDCVNGFYCDWRIEDNMFGLTAESQLTIREQFEKNWNIESDSDKATNYTLAKCIHDLLAHNLEMDCIKAKRNFFKLHTSEMVNALYERNGALPPRSFDKCVCDYVDFYFYKTSHQTLAICFEGYALAGCLEHCYLTQPFDTGIELSDQNTLQNFDTKKYEWREGTNYYKCSSSSLKLSFKDGEFHIEYTGHWAFWMTGDKYPYSLDFYFDKTTPLKIIETLSTDEESKNPKLYSEEWGGKSFDNESDLDKF